VNDAPAPSALGARFRLPKAHEFVAGNLRSRIIRGELKEGDSLPGESELMVQFGVSRPTLREAFRILEAERLIRIARGVRGGPRVLAPDREVASRYFGLLLQARKVAVGDVYRARQIIEPPAARIVAETRAPEAILDLKRLLAEARAVIDDDRGSAEASTAFFRAVVAHSGVETLVLLSSMLDDIMARSNELLWRSGAEQKSHMTRKREALQAKEKLTALIEAGDGAAAEAFLAGHMATVAQLLQKWRIAAQVVDLLGEPAP
jgi:DNA-binding FadR family transcriptional regulator